MANAKCCSPTPQEKLRGREHAAIGKRARQKMSSCNTARTSAHPSAPSPVSTAAPKICREKRVVRFLALVAMQSKLRANEGTLRGSTRREDSDNEYPKTSKEEKNTLKTVEIQIPEHRTSQSSFCGTPTRSLYFLKPPLSPGDAFSNRKLPCPLWLSRARISTSRTEHKRNAPPRQPLCRQ